MRLHRFLFTAALTITSRIVQARDRLLGRVPRSRPDCPSIAATQHAIPSGKNLLDAVYAEPAAIPPRASVLICHGIGEVVAQWYPIQRLFAEHGIASLVFDYSGYGQSTGSVTGSSASRMQLHPFIFFSVSHRLSPSPFSGFRSAPASSRQFSIASQPIAS